MYRFHLAACLLQVKVESLILYDTLGNDMASSATFGVCSPCYFEAKQSCSL